MEVWEVSDLSNATDIINTLYKRRCVLHNGRAMLTSIRPKICISSQKGIRHIVVLILICAASRCTFADDGITVDESPDAPEPVKIIQAEPTVELDRDLFLLDLIVDRKPLNAGIDSDAFYGILNHVRRVDQQALKQAAAEFLDQRWKESPQQSHFPREEFEVFPDMVLDPPKHHPYRGQPITLRGHVDTGRGFAKGESTQADSYGIENFYTVFLVTADSQSYPASVIFSENPDNIELNSGRVEVEVTGYFLKLIRVEMPSGKGQFAPLILAKEVRRLPDADASLPVAEQIAIASVIVAAVLLTIGCVWYIGRKDRQAIRQSRALAQPGEAPDLNEIETKLGPIADPHRIDPNLP